MIVVWYDNEDENAAQPEEGAASASAAAGEGQDARTPGRGFSAAADPTKAFDDDPDDLTPGPVTADEISTLKSAIKELDEKANLNYDRYLRALAELENYKKRIGRERMDLMRYAGEDLLREILPVVDNLERTLIHSAEAQDVAKVMEGIGLIQRQFQKALEKSGVSVIDQAPCAFDPQIHQALERVEDHRHPDDTVVEILQKGYILNGKVVRPALVKVAKHH